MLPIPKGTSNLVIIAKALINSTLVHLATMFFMEEARDIGVTVTRNPLVSSVVDKGTMLFVATIVLTSHSKETNRSRVVRVNKETLEPTINK